MKTTVILNLHLINAECLLPFNGTIRITYEDGPLMLNAKYRFEFLKKALSDQE